MKNLILSSLFLSVFILSAAGLKAQNPKTNAGKVGNTPPGFPQQTNPAQSTPRPSQPNNSNLNSTDMQNVPKSNDSIVSDSYTGQKDPKGSLKASNGNKGLLSIGFLIGASQGKFKEVSNDDWGYGLGITGLYNFMGNEKEEKPIVNVHMGLSFEFMYFGGKDHSTSYDDPYPYNAITNRITTSVSSNSYSLIFITRTEFFTGPIIPFVELAAGGRVFSGTESVNIDRSQKSGSTLPSGITFTPTSSGDSKNLENALTAAYGMGGGLRIGTNAIKMELKLMYMYGTTARYIDSETVKINQYNNQVSYDTKTSTTDMFMPQIGVSFNF